MATSTANIATWLADVVLDTNPGYANTIQVRIQDSGPGGAGNLGGGTYWESDIGYNTTSSPITVDGTTVPATGWAVLFPFFSATTTKPRDIGDRGSREHGRPHHPDGHSVADTGAGTVQFYDNGTFLADSTTPGSGTYTYNYTPAAGSHSYTASFIPGPPPGDESGAGTATASFVGGSTSSAVAVSDTAPQTGTTTTLSASSTSLSYGASDTFTATVGAS